MASPTAFERARLLVGAGLTMTMLGIGASLLELQEVAAVLTLCGLVLSGFGLHRLGRAGPADGA